MDRVFIRGIAHRPDGVRIIENTLAGDHVIGGWQVTNLGAQNVEYDVVPLTFFNWGRAIDPDSKMRTTALI
jgi:hypothetical protein